MMGLGCQAMFSSQLYKQWTCQARAIAGAYVKISRFAGENGVCGMSLADVASHQFEALLSRKTDTPNDNGIKAMI